jgi:predicted SnoaL-like aldol condensation-catalyzing enzyme
MAARSSEVCRRKRTLAFLLIDPSSAHESEGLFDAKPTAFYDLYRVENGKMVEHWDVLEPMPAAGQSRNKNGKF